MKDAPTNNSSYPVLPEMYVLTSLASQERLCTMALVNYLAGALFRCSLKFN
jgi:hypothetical protein